MAKSGIFNRLLSKGPVRNLQSVLSVIDDCRFDRKYGLDTRSEVAIEDLDISREDKQHADKYKPTRTRYFRKVMARVALPSGGVFVDVGCGKGRILILAAEYEFDQVVGLEISPALSRIAETNVEAFRKRCPDRSSIDVVCTNVLDYRMTGDETVFFLYSPFDLQVTKQFLKNLHQSIESKPRDVCLIIDEFRFPELLVDDPYFEQVMIYEYGAAVFYIYSYTCEPES